MKYYYIDSKTIRLDSFKNLDFLKKNDKIIYFRKKNENLPKTIEDKIKQNKINFEIHDLSSLENPDKITFAIASEIGFLFDKKNYEPIIVTTNQEFQSIVSFFEKTKKTTIKIISHI